MTRYFVLFLFILLPVHSLVAQTGKEADAAYEIQQKVMIPTRSGVDIYSIVARKRADNGPLPVVLFYTTYYQEKGDESLAKLAADRGYVGVVAYARGIRTDLKNYAPYEHEGTDVYDIIDWISKQSWCNGSVGMYSGSYTGYSQWATAKRVHPALKTIVPQVAVMPGYDMPMENNVQMNLGLYWPNDNIYKNAPIRRSLPFEWFEGGTSFRTMDKLAGIENPIFQEWLQHPAYDEYWRSMVPTPEEYAKINIPVLTTTGYYDGSQIGALQYFKLHNKHNKKANHYLVIGPYDHWGGQRNPAKNLMGYEIDAVANVSMRSLAFDWLDHILKGKPRPELLKDKVNYQVMGTNEWRHAPSLEKTKNATLRLYLSDTRSGDKYLLSDKRQKQTALTQQVDLKDRQNQNNYFTPNIVFDSLDASIGLVFETQKFEEDFLLTGSFSGNLFATINKRDMDVSMALYELMPDGKYFFLTRYVGRASYAKDDSRRQLLTPGRKESIPFSNTRFVSRKIGTGSKLVILLNINKHPFEIINYGSGKEVADETIADAGEPLKITWHGDSYIRVPILKD